MIERRALIAAAVLSSTFVLAGCPDNPAPRNSTSASPSGSASSVPTTGAAGEPVRHEKKTGPGYEIIVPSAWEEKIQTDSELNTKPVIWVMPGTAGSLSVVFVSILIDDERKSSAASQSTVLEMTKGMDKNVKAKRTQVSWKNATDAYLIEWNEPIPSQPGKYSHVMQIMAQRGDGTIVNAIGRAPDDQFDTLGIAGIVRSLKLV